jgi:crotonobetainyl-CoA:carnitine CoA-transferase CaiB-like acyl-CoA transferase
MDWKSGHLPLAGLRVVDWSLYWAGPYLGMMLHDLGAEVIKVEAPAHCDPMRTVIDVNRYSGDTGKPLTPEERVNISQHFNEWNRGKLGIGVQLAEPKGRDVFMNLAAQSHIVIENHRPGAKDKLGIAYSDVAAIKPDIIYASLSGYGQTLPERDAMALGSPVELPSGLFLRNGYLNDDTPAKTGFSYGDPVGALAALSAVLLAVRQWRKSGEGLYLDIAMRDALSFGIGAAFTDWSMNGERRPHMGNRHPVYAPQGVYRALGEDQWVAITIRDDRDWRAFVAVIGASGWADVVVEERRERHGEIDAVIEAWTSARDARDIETQLQTVSVPGGAVLDFAQLKDDPQLAARGAFGEVEHPVFGTELRATSQWERGENPQPIDRPAPCFGQHNRAVLTGLLGMSEAAVDELERDGVIADRIKVADD